MSVEKIWQALDYIDNAGLNRPYLNNKFSVDEGEISEVESRIGFSFPKSYRAFLSELGNGDFNGIEFYGLISGDLNLEEIPNALWLTLDMRDNEELPNRLFVVESLGDGTCACLLLSDSNDECPVVLWDYGKVFDESRPYILGDSFGDYFYSRIIESIAMA